VGRGNASGHGNYSGKGQKGQKSRSGAKIRRGFEGGQTPWYKKIPKYKGIKPRYPKYKIISLGLLNKHFQEGETVSVKTLRDKGLVKGLNKYRGIKILGTGELKVKNLKVIGCQMSEKVKSAFGLKNKQPALKKRKKSTKSKTV